MQLRPCGYRIRQWGNEADGIETHSQPEMCNIKSAHQILEVGEHCQWDKKRFHFCLLNYSHVFSRNRQRTERLFGNNRSESASHQIQPQKDRQCLEVMSSTQKQCKRSSRRYLSQSLNMFSFLSRVSTTDIVRSSPKLMPPGSTSLIQEVPGSSMNAHVTVSW